MKKLSLIFSILISTFIFSAVSASAQNVNKIDAKVPFAFDFGSKTYAASSYTLRISETNIAGEVVIALGDEKGHVLDSIFASKVNGIADDASRLSFGRNDGQRFLSSIALREATYTLARLDSSAPVTTTKNRKAHGKAKDKTS